MEQNFKNHTRLVTGYHGITGLLILAGLIGSIVNLINADAHTHYSAALLVVVVMPSDVAVFLLAGFLFC